MTTNRPYLRSLTAALALTVASCAVPPKPATPPPTPVATTPPVPAPLPPRVPFEAARARFVQDTAKQYGIDPAYIQSVLASAQIRDSIIAAMSRPAEAKPWRDYRPIFLTDARINGGRQFLADNRADLASAEARFGVPAEIITAIIGVETSYGANKGSYPVVDALYTLAFAYPRTGDPAKAAREEQREQFFRGELAQLFALGKETGFDITQLKGSYAGAMGWGQFMPSSYRDYAVDADGDGRRDLFDSKADVFASIANYFAKKGGWVRGGAVAVRATHDPAAQTFEPEALDPIYTITDLKARGYQPLAPVPPTATGVPLRFDGVSGPEYWLGFRNFYAITRYNISKHYAMAVYQLAESIAGRDIPPLPAAATDTPPAP
ncbi:lytic murein transglycosylase B [Lysobacter sp. TY2-98]|uniref:lytic murein transglycosylase B n=1 Tax=Lysobacter sp. TY2-98 TaxID=2290922 RepID=UPI000E1FB7BE|nr:lytic murein transglycosylase B [Lysobacter sp. TY2-98]AXK72943.1 lytic murein transglycosylase B [Lysobacter sp. TY2-98]